MSARPSRLDKTAAAVDNWTVLSPPPNFDDEAEAQDLAPIDLSAWGIEAPPPREFVIPDMVPGCAVTAINGDGGVGKTRLMLQLGISVAAGIPFLGVPPSVTGPVVFLSAEEDAASIRLMLHEVREGMGLSDETISRARRNLHVFDLTQGNPALYDEVTVTPLGLRLLNAATALCPVLLIADNASACYRPGKAGFESAPIYDFYSELLRPVRPQGGAAVVLLHEAKASLRDGNRTHAYLGGQAWNGAARSRLGMARDSNEPSVRVLKREKGNYAADDPNGIRIVWRSGAWVREDDGGVIAGIRSRNDARAVVKVLVDLRSAGELPAMAATANNNPFALATKRGIEMGDLTRARFWKGLAEARARGWVTTQVVRKDRRDREVLAVTETGETEACSHVLA